MATTELGPRDSDPLVEDTEDSREAWLDLARADGNQRRGHGHRSPRRPAAARREEPQG